jgi:hypothetical protein
LKNKFLQKETNFVVLKLENVLTLFIYLAKSSNFPFGNFVDSKISNQK